MLCLHLPDSKDRHAQNADDWGCRIRRSQTKTKKDRIPSMAIISPLRHLSFAEPARVNGTRMRANTRRLVRNTYHHCTKKYARTCDNQNNADDIQLPEKSDRQFLESQLLERGAMGRKSPIPFRAATREIQRRHQRQRAYLISNPLRKCRQVKRKEKDQPK